MSCCTLNGVGARPPNTKETRLLSVPLEPVLGCPCLLHQLPVGSLPASSACPVRAVCLLPSTDGTQALRSCGKEWLCWSGHLGGLPGGGSQGLESKPPARHGPDTAPRWSQDQGLESWGSWKSCGVGVGGDEVGVVGKSSPKAGGVCLARFPGAASISDTSRSLRH